MDIVILAAGKGTRMKSQKAKVLHPLLFQPMLHRVIELSLTQPHEKILVVVSHQEDEVRKACAGFSRLTFVSQGEPRGTGHALQVAMPHLSPDCEHFLVLSGDVALLRPNTLERLSQIHREKNAEATLVTARATTPNAYGRILRDNAGNVTGIREARDCSAEQLEITEVNAGIYLFSKKAAEKFIGNLTNHNAQSEIYLTDLIEKLVSDKKTIASLELTDSREMLGINDRVELAFAENLLRERINANWMREGVTMMSPETIWIDPSSKIAPDVTIEPGVILINSIVQSGTHIESQCRIVDSQIGKNCQVRQGSYLENSRVGNSCQLGPYARLRPESKLAENVKIGNFVELKKASFGKSSKASHLSYVGDADIGENVNLGCGFITCNYDGSPTKHRTVIDDNVFIGSDSQVVAPVHISAGSYVASGTTVTESCPPDSLILSRGKQVTKPGYAKKYQQKLQS